MVLNLLLCIIVYHIDKMTLYWHRARGRVRGESPRELIVVLLPGSHSHSTTLCLSAFQIKLPTCRNPRLRPVERIVITPLITILKSPSTMDAVMEILQQIPAQGPTPTAVQVCAMQPSLHVSIKGFMGSVQDPIETSTVPTSTTHPTTMPPSAIQASNNTQSSTQLPTERTYPPGFFFQRIRCWTDEQLDALNISHNPMVSPRILIENNYIPTRRDRGISPPSFPPAQTPS